MLKEVLSEVRSQSDPILSYNKSIKDWRESGRSVFGYLCTNIPEELIYAANVLPVRLIGGNLELYQAYNHLPSFVCCFTRSCLESALNGDYGDLDGIVMGYGCDAGCLLFHILIKNMDLAYRFFVYHPLNTETEYAVRFFEEELERFKSSIEEFIGGSITEELIRDAIKVYNKNRILLKRLYDIRGKNDHIILTGTQVAELVVSSMLMEKRKSNRLLVGVLESVKGVDGIHFKGPRIHVSGSMLSDLELFDLIEECGGMVVSDDICIGSRYFWNLVDEYKRPVTALAERYLRMIPCAGMCSGNHLNTRLAHIKKMIKDYKVDGVIFSIPNYCDPQQFDYPFIAEELEKEGIPFLAIEVEKGLNEARVKNKLEAFFEILGDQ